MSPRLAPGIAWQTIDGEGVVLDLERGRSLGLNATAALILSLLETHTEEAIAAEISKRFGVTAEAAAVDLKDFLDVLRQNGLLIEA